MEKKSILLVEDNRDIAQLVAMNLREQSCEVTVTHDGVAALDLALSGRFDLIILDIMLPGLDGLEICRRLRARALATPVLMLTAKTSEFDRVLGLELGADDYLIKPFSLRELMARVKAILRRMERLAPVPVQESQQDHLVVGELVIDSDKRAVQIEGHSVELTAKEYELLLHFARHPGRVYSRTQLLSAIWGYGYSGYEHTVNSHINRLRNKIEPDPAHPNYLLTVWGVGYKFNDRLCA